MIYEVPLTTFSGQEHFTIQVPFEGIDFLVTFDWNTTDSRWYMLIADVEGNILVTSRKLVLDYPLLARFTNPYLPKGDLLLWDTSAATWHGTLPGVTDLGSRVKLLYFESANYA